MPGLRVPPRGWANPPKISRGARGAGSRDAGDIDEPAGNSVRREGPSGAVSPVPQPSRGGKMLFKWL